MKGPSKQFKPFSAATCERIRSLVTTRRALESKRATLFETRNGVKAEMESLTAGEKARKQDLLAQYGETCMEIDRHQFAIRKATADLDEVVEKADEPGLFEDDEAMPTAKEYLSLASEKPKDPRKPDDQRPVGRPAPHAPGRVKPEAPSPDHGDGVDEHLKASVNELDCPEKIKGKLTTAGLTSIGAVVEVFEDSRRSIEEIASLTDRERELLAKAVGAFRGKHRKAAAAVERGEQ